MNKVINISLFILLLTAVAAFKKPKARILIIGDSISIGYTPFVQKNLEDVATVVHNPGNAQHTGTGLSKLAEWIGKGDYDIIQFNWGLWDLCYRHPDSKVQGNRDKENGKITFNRDEYASNLDSLVKLTKAKTGAKLIFVTTTYVPEKEAGRFSEDAVKYNEAAKKVMKANNVLVNDIFEKSIGIHRQYGKGADDVHYTAEGYEKLGQEISAFLKKEL